MADYDHLWKNNARIDKPHLSIAKGVDGWVIRINGVVAMSHCPCCLKEFAYAHHARRCVDMFWPGEEVSKT